MAAEALGPLFTELRERFVKAASGMVVASETDQEVVLHAPWNNPQKPKEPMWFGAVQTKKNYVAVHLMPLYSHPDLVEELSPELRRHMQGKSCFNFKKADPALFGELEQAAARCAGVYAVPFAMQKGGKPG